MPVLTAISVQNYRKAQHRREIADSKAQGLFLIVQPTGQKSWAVRLRRPDGRTAKLTLGPVDLSDKETSDEPVQGAALTLGQARELAAQIDRKRVRGIDVVEEHKAGKLRQRTAAVDRATNSFAACAREFFGDYRTKRGSRPRRWRDDAATLGLRYPPGSDPATTEPVIIKGSLAESWADKPVADLDGHDINVVVEEARKHGNDGRARKLHSALSVLFTWLQRRRRVTVNPTRGVWRPGPPPPRDRVLSSHEIRLFWNAAGRIGGAFGALCRTLLLTGCRLREASNMTRAELSDEGLWTIPAARTKNHRAHTLPLPQAVLDVIASAPVIEGDAGYVFSTDGKSTVSGFSKAKKAVDAEMAKIAGQAITPFRLHDLRRTFASGLAALGVQLPVIERLLNHVSGTFGGIVSVYQKFEFSEEKADALQRWAKHVQGLTSDKPSNVATPSPGKKRRS